jgi:hypothetical protein
MGLSSEATENIAVRFDGVVKNSMPLKSASSRTSNEISYVESNPGRKCAGTAEKRASVLSSQTDLQE